MDSFRAGILVFVGRGSEKEGPMVGWIRTDTNFILEPLSFLLVQLWACSEEVLCPEPPLLLLEEAILDEQILANLRF